MTKAITLRGVVLFITGVLLGGFIVSRWNGPALSSVSAMGQEDSTQPPPDTAAMLADIAHLKEVVPSQSHTMTDVGFQFANLWFAGKSKNWPLADFYFNEARQHIMWTIRIRPVRRSPSGGEVDLRPIFDGIDKGPLTQLRQAIDEKDSAQFALSYRQTLEACHGCHIASGKPYLRPRVPLVPPQPLLSYDPDSGLGADARSH